MEVCIWLRRFRNGENHKFALCIENDDCEDLEKRNVYQILPDAKEEKEGYLRVVDAPVDNEVSIIPLLLGIKQQPGIDSPDNRHPALLLDRLVQSRYAFSVRML